MLTCIPTESEKSARLSMATSNRIITSVLYSFAMSTLTDIDNWSAREPKTDDELLVFVVLEETI